MRRVGNQSIVRAPEQDLAPHGAKMLLPISKSAIAGRRLSRPRSCGAEITVDKAADDDMEHAALRYIAAARPVQELISQTLTQVAGFALLLMMSRRAPLLAEGALIGAREAAARAAEAVRALTVPESAAHHHHHLRAAAEALGQACALASACLRPEASDGERDRLSRALRAASDDLRVTARLLPGFELVDFGRACCAAHAPQRLLREAS